MPNLPKCPHCGSDEVVRSHRRPLERLLFVIRPYRCEICQHRFLTLRSHTQKHRTAVNASVE